MMDRPAPSDRNEEIQQYEPLLRKSDESAWTIVPSRLSISAKSTITMSSDRVDMIYRRLSCEDDLLTARVYKQNLVAAYIKANGPSKISVGVSQLRERTDINESYAQLADRPQDHSITLTHPEIANSRPISEVPNGLLLYDGIEDSNPEVQAISVNVQGDPTTEPITIADDSSSRSVISVPSTNKLRARQSLESEYWHLDLVAQQGRYDIITRILENSCGKYDQWAWNHIFHHCPAAIGDPSAWLRTESSEDPTKWLVSNFRDLATAP